MHSISQQNSIHMQEKILGRYEANKRVLPRRDTYNPYYVLVSEVMLQQTQVDRVIPKFNAFIEALPELSDLAVAPKDMLLTLRSWLWFNSRVLRLQKCAQEIVERFGGIIPQDRKELLSLPWIWPYTSCSVLAFAYNLPVPVIDTNVRRVYIVELGLPEDISLNDLEDVAMQVIPHWRANDRYNAVMDYGALHMTAKKTGVKPLSKQSAFEGSARQVRWKIIKHLVLHKTASVQHLRFFSPHDRFDEVLEQLIKEWMIQREDDILKLAW